MEPQIRHEAKSRTEIPRVVVIVIIIIFIGLVLKAGQYVLGHFDGKQEPEAGQKALPNGTSKARSSSSSSGVQPARGMSDYEMVTENNLLRPLGWEKPVEIPRVREPVVRRERRWERPVSLSDLVFTGIVRLGDDTIAIVEDASSGKAYFLKEGDMLKDHSVESIAEENIVLVSGDSRITSTLGSKTRYDSSGRILISELASTQEAREDVAKNTDEAPALSDESTPDLSLIERMRARRRRELESE